MEKKVLITGASGLIGSLLSKALLLRGYKINILTREKKVSEQGITYFDWDIKKGKIDPSCINGVQAIIHLAGENIAARPWRQEQKQRIIKSRTDSIRLIYSLLKHCCHNVKTVISASASGYYGDRGSLELKEDSPPGNDFMAHCCIAWERAVSEGEGLGLRVVKLRTGLILSKEGGVLPLMIKPVKWGIGAVMGTGEQWVSWIHIQDAVEIYCHALENESCKGAYNMSAPLPICNKALMEGLSHHFGKRLIPPNIPKLVLRIVLGEMRALVLNSVRMSCNKIKESGFIFRFDSFSTALENIYDK